MGQFCKCLLHTLGVLAFLVSIGSIFVGMAVMLGKTELVFLVLFLLLGCLVKSWGGRQLSYLADLPLVGDATRILQSLEKFYAKNPPQVILYYLLYPVTSVVRFFVGSPLAKNELGKYFTLIHWVILILFIEGAVRSYQFYHTFGLGFTVKWCVLEFILVYFLCNLFAIPLIVSTIRLSLAKAHRRLAFITVATMVSLSAFFYYFAIVCQFGNLIPVNIVVEKRLADYPQDKDSFVYRLRDATTMFLHHHLPELRKEIDSGNAAAALRDFNDRYRQVLLSICPYEENRFFYFTTNRNLNDWWGLVFVPMRDSLFFAFHCKPNGELKVYDRWQDIAEADRDRLARRWKQESYQPSLAKQLARVIMEETRDTMKKMQQREAKRQDAVAQDTADKSPAQAMPSMAAPNKGIAANNKPQPAMVEQELVTAADNEWVESAQRNASKPVAPDNTGGNAPRHSPGNPLAPSKEQVTLPPSPLETAIEGLHNLSAQLKNIEESAGRQQQAMASQLTSLLADLHQWQPQMGMQGGLEFSAQLAEIESKWRQEWQLRGQQEMLTALASLRQQQAEFTTWLRRCRAFEARCQDIILTKNPLQQSQVPARMMAYFGQCMDTLRQKTPDYQGVVARIADMRQHIALAHEADYFVVHDPAVAAFHFARSVQFRFITDHRGQSPDARSENRITQIFSIILSALLWFFGLCMPLHVALIIFAYCQYREA